MTRAGTASLLAATLAASAFALAVPPAPRNLPPPAVLDFPTQVLPQLTRLGCNGAACHGAARGRGGFSLSLFGGDPRADFLAIARADGGRRLRVDAAPDSLLLRKAWGELDHGGGPRLRKDSAAAATLTRWIAAGAPYGGNRAPIVGLDATPPDARGAAGASVTLRVAARRADGTREDVTSLALFTSNDDGVASVSPEGRVTLLRPGIATILVRYAGQATAVRVRAPFAAPRRAAAEVHPVDRALERDLAPMGVTLAAQSDPATFLRRVTLDLAGRLPDPAEVRAFLRRPDRPAAIERLLASDGFVDLWTLRFADLLRIDSKRLGDLPARRYHEWLRKGIAANTPLDRLTRELLVADPSNAQSAPAAFWKIASDPRDRAEFAARTLLGTRVGCARCHNHPYDRWTTRDYHRFAALFAQPPQWLSDPDTDRPIAPRSAFGGAALPVDAPAALRRASLADSLLAGTRPRLAAALVNRVWAALMGRGLVEPVDDLREGNPPLLPGVLDTLTADFVRQGWDLRRLVRTIATSRAYGRAAEGAPGAERLFARAIPQPIDGAVLADAIARATGVPDRFPGYPEGTRAVRLLDARVPSESLDLFGRCLREADCTPESARGGGLPQALHLLNGAALEQKARVGGAALAARFARDDRALVEELFLRTLSRLPRAAERTWATGLLGQAGASGRAAAAADLLWALVNTREFGVRR